MKVKEALRKKEKKKKAKKKIKNNGQIKKVMQKKINMIENMTKLKTNFMI